MEAVAEVNTVDDEYGLEGNYNRRKDSLKTLENEMERSMSKKERIIYDKDFLLECFFLPCSRQKPNDFPLPNLGCTLGSIKFTGNSPFATAPPYVPPKRKEENGRRDRDRDPDDNISLRPHSGNFSGGCGPSNNSNSPLASRDRDGMNAGLQMILDEHFRDHARNNSLRFAPNKRFELPNDRVRSERERDRDFKDGRDTRDTRDRNNRTERNQFNQRRTGNPQAAWGTDVPERESDWNRRRNRNGSGGTYGKDKKGFFDGKDRGYYRDRGGGGDRDEEEPEWFSGGPTSQHDTIELRGFMDDDRRDSKPLEPVPSGEKVQNSSSNGSTKNSDVTQEANEEFEENSNMDMNLEKILKMVHIPHLLPTGLLEDEEPSGTSRFSGIFQKNSEISIPKAEKPTIVKKSALDALIEARIAPRAATNSTDETEGKKEITEELGNALRSMLLNPSRSLPAERRQQPVPMEFIAREAPPKKTDEKESNSGVNVLQLLLDKMIDPKNKTVSGRSSVDSEERSSVGPAPGLNTPRRTSHPTEVTAMALNQLLEQNSQGLGPQRPEQYHSQPSQDIEHAFNIPMNCNMRPPMPQQMPQPSEVNPFQVFESLIRQQHPPNVPREVLNGHQIMQMLPPEIQFFVQHSNPAEDFWTQSDSRALIAALTTGEFTFRKVLQDLVAPQCVRKPFLASLVQMVVTGNIVVPSLTLVGPPIKFVNPEVHQTHLAQKQQYNHHESSSRNNDEYALEMRRRSGTPVSAMAFTPTSVMRKMTAEPPKPITHPINSNSQAVHPGPQHSSNKLAHPPQDFSFIVSQLTGQQNRPQHGPPQHGPPQHGPPQHGTPQHGPPQMHPAHFQPIQAHGQVMGLPPAGMFMHPGYRMVPPPQVMSIPHSHREMPQS